MVELHRLHLKLGEWAIKHIGNPMNSISAKFESYAAPLATALLCAALASHGGGNHHSSRADVAGGGVGGGGGRGGSFSHEHEHELRELHLKLQKMLFKCVKRKDDLSHRLIGLKCLTLQLPTLIVAKGPTKENLAAIDRLFDICREHTMQVECRSDKDVPISLRKYADLLTAHSRLVLALANVNFELVVQEIIMKKLNYFQTKHKFGHDSVVALAALHAHGAIGPAHRRRQLVEGHSVGGDGHRRLHCHFRCEKWPPEKRTGLGLDADAAAAHGRSSLPAAAVAQAVGRPAPITWREWQQQHRWRRRQPLPTNIRVRWPLLILADASALLLRDAPPTNARNLGR